jgi:cardiolipin synthase
VIDGQLAFTGGINVGEEYAGFGGSPHHWRDVGVGLAGPAAGILQTLFAEAWQGETGRIPEGGHGRLRPPTTAGDAEVYVVSGGPHHNRSFIRNTFRMAIAGAVTEIVIANPYFIPGPRITRSLLRAARRGVAVKLILPAVSDVPLVRLVSRSSYTPLLQAGIRIFERQQTVLHAKIMLVDGSWTVIGSANLDQRSFHRNFEVNCIVTSQEFGGQVAVMLAEELAQSRPVHLDDHERRGWLVRILERLLSMISWFL